LDGAVVLGAVILLPVIPVIFVIVIVICVGEEGGRVVGKYRNVLMSKWAEEGELGSLVLLPAVVGRAELRRLELPGRLELPVVLVLPVKSKGGSLCFW
jgi:hypothetical protein